MTPMSAERWRQIKAVFVEALDCADDERAAFLARACAGDAELRHEVASLLESERASASFAETPAATLLAQHGDDALPARSRLQAGARLGAYEIVSFISAGGMGEVYRARHSVLGRVVAIKRVNPLFADDAAKRRLIREARHASVLSHPNICAIFEVGEADGTPFVVMQLADGASLRERISHGVPELNRALDIGARVAAALEHAHEHGIVHRDLKSANVVVDENGRTTVLDFGLARRLPRGRAEQSAESSVTASGTIAGTLSHMAPELLRGEEADARSDIWSLGVMLYELVTGHLPFEGRTQFETTSAILSDPVPPVGRSVPLALRLVVERCLAKNPSLRYQRAADVRLALERIRRRRSWPLIGPLILSTHRRMVAGSAAVAAAIALCALAAYELRDRVAAALVPRASTLAVLPFEGPAGDSLAAYYANGITEALIARLGTIARGRILAFGATSGAPRTADSRAAFVRRLNADAVVEGQVRKSGDRIVVDVRVLEPRSRRVLWSDSYDRGRPQIVALEDDVARALAAEVRLTIRPDAPATLARTVNPEAYEEYLKGRFEWNKRTTASLRSAVTHFQAALELDSTYAPAHAALADCYNQFGTQLVGLGSPREFRPRAAAEAIRALQIDASSAEAHAALGYVRHYEWQWNDAEQEFRRAIELNPSYALAHLWYANLLMSRRRYDEALAHARMARDLDPFSLIINTNIGWVLAVAGRPAEAAELLRQTLALDSTYVQAHVRLVAALVALGRVEDARREGEDVVRRTNGSLGAVAGLARLEALAGHDDAARARLNDVLARARDTYVPPAAIGMVYSALGDTAGQDLWLQRAFDEHSNAIAYMWSEEGLWLHDSLYVALRMRAGLR